MKDAERDLGSLRDHLFSGEEMELEYIRGQKVAEEMKRAVKILESLYAEDGLMFSIPFNGVVPVQAYGEIHGYRFYFRHRYDSLFLRIGPVNKEFDDLYNEALKARSDERAEAHAEVCDAEDKSECFECLFLGSSFSPSNTHLEDYYPHQVVFSGYVNDYTGEEYAGSFNTAEEAVKAFQTVLESVKQLPYEDQFEEHALEFMSQYTGYEEEDFDRLLVRGRERLSDPTPQTEEGLQEPLF